jgi:hypothetical protein
VHHYVPDYQKVAGLVYVSQSLHDSVLEVVRTFPLDLLNDLVAYVGFMLKQDVLHDLPVPETNLDDAFDLRSIDEMLKIDEVFPTITGI